MGGKDFLARPLSYRVCAVAEGVFSILLAIGVACPYWYQTADGSSYGGLWSRCDASAGSCASLTTDVAEDWWLAVQVLEPLALFLTALSCSALIFENCFADVHAPAVIGEVPGLTGGFLGLTGCVVFVAKAGSSSSPVYSTISWSFYFALFGCVVVFIASIVILIKGKIQRKSLSLHQRNANVSPEPSRRFSHLWATESPSTPIAVRKAKTSSRESTSLCPTPTNLHSVTLSEEM